MCKKIYLYTCASNLLCEKNGDSTFKLAFSVTSAIKSDNKLAYTTTTVLT